MLCFPAMSPFPMQQSMVGPLVYVTSFLQLFDYTLAFQGSCFIRANLLRLLRVFTLRAKLPRPADRKIYARCVSQNLAVRRAVAFCSVASTIYAWFTLNLKPSKGYKSNHSHSVGCVCSNERVGRRLTQELVTKALGWRPVF